MRRGFVIAGSATLGVLLLGGTASASDCGNFSRATNGTPWETARGRWFLISTDIGTFWVFGSPENFMNGAGNAILDNAACPTGRLAGQLRGTLDPAEISGIWSEGCFERAAAGLNP